VQRDPRLSDGVRRVVGHGPRVGEAVRRRRGTGHRQFRTQHAVGIPHVRVRQPVPSGAVELFAGVRTGRGGNYRYSQRSVSHGPLRCLFAT